MAKMSEPNGKIKPETFEIGFEAGNSYGNEYMTFSKRFVGFGLLLYYGDTRPIIRSYLPDYPNHLYVHNTYTFIINIYYFKLNQNKSKYYM